MHLAGSSSGRVAQLGERVVRNDEVAGSNPVTSTTFSTTYTVFRTKWSRSGWPIEAGSVKPIATRSAQYPRKNAQINPGRADTTEIFFAANKVDRGSDWRQVNNERAGLAEHANRQGARIEM